MNIYSMTDEAIAIELGARIQRQRLNRNITQDQLAEEVGVSKPTIVQLERGQAKLTTLIAAMRALGILDQVSQIVPEVPPSPLQVLKMKGTARMRATGRAGRQSTGTLTAREGKPPVTHSKRVSKDSSEW